MRDAVARRLEVRTVDQEYRGSSPTCCRFETWAICFTPLGADGGGPGHLVRTEEGQVTWCGRRRERSLGADGGGRGHLVRTEEGQVTWCGRRRERSFGADGGGTGHLVRMEEGQVTWCGRRRDRSLGADGGGTGHLVRVEEGQGHVVRMDKYRLPKKAEAVKQPGRRQAATEMDGRTA